MYRSLFLSPSFRFAVTFSVSIFLLSFLFSFISILAMEMNDERKSLKSSNRLQNDISKFLLWKAIKLHMKYNFEK